MEMLKKTVFLLMLTIPLAALGGQLLVADAGPDQTVSPYDQVELDGTGTALKNRGLNLTKPITYSWTQIEGTLVTLNSADTANPDFTAPQPNADGNVLRFELTATASIGMGRGSGARTVTDSDIVEITITSSSIAGRVTDVAGNAIDGATIDLLLDGSLIQSRTSADGGNFDLVVANDREYVLKFSVLGYAAQIFPVRSPAADGSIFLEGTMIAQGDPQTFSGSSDAILTGLDGAAVSVSAGSFVDAEGNLVTGTIRATITPVDISHPASLAAFPGAFFGVAEGDTEATPIISYGAVEFLFTQDGQPLQLAEGASAAVEIPIYVHEHQHGTSIAVGESIPLWSLNEDTGLWTQEGEGIVFASGDSPTGLAMEAQVSHFTWWNCDVTMNPARAIVTVVSADSGTALVRARTTANIGWRPTTVDTVASLGVPTAPLFVPSNGEVCFWAEINYTNGSSATTVEECVTAAANSLEIIDLTAPVDGPLTITTQPAGTGGVLDVTSYIGFPVDPVGLRPSTIETTVSYSILSGSLPAGVTLNAVNATRAELTGIPTAAGSFNVTVEGTDADGFSDSVTVNYEISADAAEPDLGESVSIGYSWSSVPVTVDLNDYNSGGPVSNWSMSPSSPAMTLDPDTGLLTITAGCQFYGGELTATNDSGNSVATLSVVDTSCD